MSNAEECFEPELEARGLTKYFHGIAAVSGVEFRIRRGEVVGYLGPNGSGKSTTVQMLAGLLRPSSGAVLFNGAPVERDPIAFRRRLGYVPEEPHLYPFLSGREYLLLVGRLRELHETMMQQKVPALLEILGILQAADQDIGSYSKGMKQKLLISAALLHDPDVVIFDEPESGLDLTSALVLRHLVRALANHGKAVLYSSHVLDTVEKVATRVVVLCQGKIVANDSVQRLRMVMASPSLEDVVSQLAIDSNPEQTALDIVALIGKR